MRKKWNRVVAFCLLCAVVFVLAAASPGTAFMKDKDDKTPAADQGEYAADEIIVKFEPGMEEAEKDALKDRLGVRTVKKHSLTGSELVKIKNKEKDKVKDVIEKLKKNSRVVYAEPNYVVHAQATAVDDPRFGELWGINNTGQVINGAAGVADVDLDAPEAWDNEQGSPEVVVGIIDTGVDISHPDIAANIWTNPGEIPGDGIDNDGNGYIDDVHGWDFYNDHASVFEAGDHFHATHVAGTIAGIANNGIGVAGVAPRVKIMPIQFLGPGGSGSISDAIDALGYARLMGVRITNNSWGGGGFSQALHDAIVNWGGVFVAAAGNSSMNADYYPMYPAAYDCGNIISVAAINNQGGLAYFSNYGATTVDVGAPGLDVLSSMPGNAYGYLSGTSMATPHVAGIVALILSRSPVQTPESVRELIMQSAAPLASLQGKTLSGGMAKAQAALMKLDVRFTDPANGAIEVPVDKTISVTYNMDVQAGANFGGITLTAGETPAEIVSQVTGSVLTIDPVSNLEANKTYTVAIPAGAIQKTDGTALAAYTFSFKTPDTIAPTILGTDPVDGSETVMATKTITVTISEYVVKGSNFGLITLATGTTPVQSTISLNGAVLTIDPVLNLGNNTSYTVTIPDNAITDPAGNAVAAYTFGFATPVDALPPTVQGSDPADGANYVPVSKTLTVTFSESIVEGANFSGIELKTGATATVAAQMSIAGNILSIAPASNLTGETAYTVTVPAAAVTDTMGNILETAYTFGFTTADITPPAVVGTYPANGATNVPVGTTITVNLSEATAKGPNFTAIVLKDAAGNTVNAGIDYYRYWDEWEEWVVDTSIIVIDPVADLQMGKVYFVTVPADAVRDPGGLPNEAYSFSFRTPFTITSTDPVNNAVRVPLDKTVTVTFSENAVQGPAFGNIALKTGATTIQSAISINANALTIDPVANLNNDTVYTVTIPADSIRNSAAVPLNAYSFSFRTPDITPPAVTSTSPANNATSVAVGTTVVVSLTEETSAGPGFSAITLKDEAGTTVPSAVYYNSGSDDEGDWTDTRTIMINPVADLVAGKVYTATIPADAVRDKDGNPNSLYSFHFSTPFTVTATSPVNNATRVPVDQTISVTLSGNGVQGPAFGNITLKAGATTIQSAISINANALTIDPVANLNNDTVYTVTIPADSIRNSAAVPLNAYSFSFRTPDITPPAVSSTSPANNATNVGVGTTINVNLSEDTTTGPNFGGIALRDSAGNIVSAAIDYYRYWDDWEWAEIVDTRLILIDPAANLEMGKIYTVTVPADAVRDKDANPNGQYSFSFSTPFMVTGSNPASNATQVPVNQTITVTLSGNGVQGPAFGNITLKAGTTTIESAISLNANALTIDPAANLANDTTYIVTIPADSIRNGAGVPINAYNLNFRTLDIVFPAVTGTIPANGATGIALGTTINVNLSEDTATGPNFSGITLKDSAGNTVSAAVDYFRYWDDWEWAEIVDTRLILIDPVADLVMGKTYVVTVPADAVRDKDGNPNSLYSFSFSTSFMVTATSPASNATQVPVDQTITITLSGNGVQGPAFGGITLKAGATTIESTISLNANVLTIDPAASLSNDTVYTVTVPADSIRNSAGVPINAYGFNFRTPDILAPAVSSTTPADGATSIAVGTTINVNLSEDTAAGPNFGGIILKDSAGNAVNAAIDYYSYWDDWEWAEIVDTRLILIDPGANLEMGKIYTVTVPADSVRDKDGNPNAAYSFSFSTPFMVMSTNPVNGATGVPVDQAITVTLAHNGVQGPNFNGIMLKKGSMPVQSAVSMNGNVLTILPASYLDNDGTYTVTIPADAVRDEHGHPNGQYNFGFTTRSRVTITNPAHNVIQFPTDQTITVNLSENGVQGPAFGGITLKAGTTTIESTISLNANVLTIDPAANLANDTVYTVTVPADSIRNAEGVSLNAYSFNFRTLDIVPPAVSGSTPANSATNVAVGTSINVNLSEDTATGPNFSAITLKDSAGNTVNAAIDYYRYWDDWEWAEIVDTRLIVIDPAANLETGKTYTVAIPADAVRDKDGNPNAQYSFSFSTPSL